MVTNLIPKLLPLREIPEAWVRVPFEGIKQGTEKALLLNFGDKVIWMPKAWVHVGTNEDGILCVDMPEWVQFKHDL